MAKHPVCQQHLSPSESAFYDSCESPLKSAPTSPREEMFYGHCDSLLRAVSSVSVASPEIIYCDVCGSPQSPATVWPPKPEWAQQLAAYESQGRYHAMAELGRSHLSTTHGPHAVALRLKLAGVYDSVCNLAEAKALLEQVLEEHPGHPKALADLARLLEVQRDWTGLAALYRQALERVPDPEAQVSYTRQLARLATWRLRDSQLAIMYWRRVLARQEDREAREALTRFYEELGEQEALAELRRSDPKASSAHQDPAPRRPVSWPRVPDATPRRIAYGMVHMLGGLSMHLAFGAALMIITTMLGLMVLYIADQLGEDELYLGAAVSGLVALIGLGMALVAGSKLLTQLRLLTYGLRATGIITEVSVNPNRTVNEQPATRIVWEYEDADGQTQTGHTDCFDAQRIALHPQGTEVDVLTLGTVPSMVPSLMGIVFWVPRTMSEAPTAASPDGSSATIADGGTLLFTAVPTHSALVEQLMALFAQRYGTSAHLRRDALAMNRVEEAAEQVLDILATQSTTTLKLPFLTADAQGPQHLTATVNVRPSSHQAPALHNPVHLAREPWPLPEHLTTTAAWPLHGQPVEARRGCLAPRASLLQMGRLELADEGHTLLRKGRQGDSLARLDLDVPFATHLSVWQRSSDQVELTVSLVERGAAANRLTCRVALTQACVGSTVARQRSSAPF
ncbi:MAG: tetratricopeptide repeat protein, partial [Myxococcota bacterium]